MPEIRWEATTEETAILDGYCSATGTDRSKVIRNLLRELSEKKEHEAMVICSVAGINPTIPEVVRK